MHLYQEFCQKKYRIHTFSSVSCLCYVSAPRRAVVPRGQMKHSHPCVRACVQCLFALDVSWQNKHISWQTNEMIDCRLTTDSPHSDWFESNQINFSATVCVYICREKRRICKQNKYTNVWQNSNWPASSTRCIPVYNKPTEFSYDYTKISSIKKTIVTSYLLCQLDFDQSWTHSPHCQSRRRVHLALTRINFLVDSQNFFNLNRSIQSGKI